MLIAAHNLTAMNAQRQYGITTKNRAKTAEKLSTGYDINRAADNAAGLAISEKMRRLIRGLERGTKNAEDGVSWTQIGDGALNEVHDILHRMTELSIQSLNETNSEKDRAYLQSEFEHLQTELDRISKTTEFNELNIFEEHEPTYYQCEGDIQWPYDQIHTIEDGRNDLTIKYRKDDKGSQETINITVPAGDYTTQELVDKIDSALEDAGGLADGIMFQLTPDGYCNVNFEGGEVIDAVSGSLSYLLYEMNEGGEFGALIGTTNFVEGRPLKITSENDTLAFTIQDINGNETEKQIQIPAGWYYKEDLIDYLNNELQGTDIKATEYGTGIKLGGEESIVTKFKGNMFKIDAGNNANTSVFYDNVSYGSVELESAYFQGGHVLPSNTKDVEYNVFRIGSTNNQLTIQANDMTAPVTVTISEGEYSITQMTTQLNSIFANTPGLEKLSVTYSSSNGYYGLRITSQVEGNDSKIDIDASSSAYNELFVNREYTDYYPSYGDYKANVTNETKSDSIASFKGSKDLSGISGTTPLAITSGVNDTFTLKVDSDTYNKTIDITMSAGDYTSASQVADEINAQLSNAGLTDIEAVVTNNSIKIQGKDTATVKNITVEAKGTNGGFEAVLQGYSLYYTTQSVGGRDSITLNGEFDGVVDASDNPLKITVNDKNYYVQLPVGDNVSQDDIIQAIEQTISGETKTELNTFSPISDTGTTTDRNRSRAGRGGTTPSTWNGSNVGETIKNEGTTGLDSDRPASVEMPITLPSTIKVKDGSNKISLTINGVTKEMTIDSKSYSQSEFVTALQKAIDDSFGDGYGGAKVSINNGKLALTARTDAYHFGENTSIACGTSSSSLLKDLNSNRTSAKVNTEIKLSNSVVIDGSTNTFSFTLEEDGVSSVKTITLNSGSYSRDSLLREINNKLSANRIGVTASVNSNGYLVLETTAKGNEYRIAYNSENGGTSAQVIFGDLIVKEPAEAYIDRKPQQTIVLDDTTNNNLSVTVNGVVHTVELDEGTYTIDTLITEMNDKLSVTGLEACKSSTGLLGFKTVEKGNQQSFSVSYDANSVMKPIYGETTTTYPAVTASFNGNKLTLSAPGANLYVSSNSGAGLQKPKENKSYIDNTVVEGYKSNVHGTIDGGKFFGEPINIDEYSDNLSFTFVDEGTTRNISIDVPDGDYTYAQMETTLQSIFKDTTVLGPGKLTVKVDANGVVIKTVGTGLNNKLLNPSGDFYEKVLTTSREYFMDKSDDIQDVDGRQVVSKAYVIGRQDVAEGVKIRAGISDELMLDLTINGTEYNFQMKLDPGDYSGTGIKNHIQEKLDEQLVAQGFEAGMIEVGLGDIKTNVVGANDENALNFRLSNVTTLDEEGEYIIDGIGGNAAFAVFYSTDGELLPAYVMGSKDVSNGVRIEEGDNNLEFTVDGVSYEIELDPKYYSQTEIVDAINEKLEEQGVPLLAEKEDDKVKISHVSLGKHSIEVSGNAKDDIFFRENGAREKDKGVRIQLSSEVEDYLEIPRTEYSSSLIGINTICISKVDHATKALDRISKAVDIVSNLRSMLGSAQNRLEHAINSNENKTENTQAAESRIRDADMAERMMELSKQNILQQVGEAMMSQANNSNQGILSLLQ